MPRTPTRRTTWLTSRVPHVLALTVLSPLAFSAGTLIGAVQVRSAADLAKAAFVTNRGSDNVASFVVQPNGVVSGRPRLVALPDGLRGAAAAVLSPDGRFLFVGSWGSHAIATFSIDSFGTLTAVGSAPHPPAAASNTTGLAISADGRFLYAASYNDGAEGSVAVFSVGDDGMLSPLGEPAQTEGLGAVGITLSPDGRRLYVAHMTSGTISVFAVGDDGDLTLNGTTQSGDGTFSLLFSPTASQLYAANAFDATISVYSVKSDGALELQATPVASGAKEPRGIALSPDGKLVYVSHFNGGVGAGSVTRFTIRIDGALQRQGVPVQSGGRGASALVARGTRLYVVNTNQRELAGSISSLMIAQDGSLSRQDAVLSTGGQSPDWGGLVLWPQK